MLSNVSTLIFDLDGTISNPSLGITRCINYALASHGFHEVPAEAVAAEIGPPLDETFLKFQPNADQPLVSSLIAKYRERYAEVGYAENELYPGISEELPALSGNGVLLGICTSKRRDFAEKIVSHFGLLPHFKFIDGGDVGIKKREQLSRLLRSGEIDHDAVMVGDRAVDILAAQGNGLRSTGVLWGFGSAQELSEAGPSAILEEVRELGRLVF
ncbi:MAG: HAD-IA family hydrolase [Desulfobulbaceae bacterium]|nr:HAD-IA family hydrolase [Desulfobulbaceae bacterium]